MFKNRKNNKCVIQKESTEKAPKKVKSTSAGAGFYYSFLTIILLLCLAQITISAVLNVSKIVSYKAKIVQITKTRDAAQSRNEQLKDSIKDFSEVKGLEAIARNNLKMSGEDEVLVIINTQKDEGIEKPHKFSLLELIRKD